MTTGGETQPVSAAAGGPPASERQSSAWDVRNAHKNYIWLLLFQGGSSAFAFGAVWLITRPLGREGYGAVFAVLAASQIVQIFLNWTTVAVVRYGVDEFVETASIARTFWSRFVILFVNLAVVIALAPVWFDPLAEMMKLSSSTLWLLVAHVVLSVLWLHVQMGLQAAKMLREQGMLQMFERLVICAGVGAIFAAGTLDITSAVVCYVVGPAAMTVAGLFILRNVVFRRFTLDAAIVKKTLVYSVPLLPYWLVGVLSGNYVDAAFISNFLSKADLGVYAIATQINGIALQVPTIANTILFPLFITQQAETGGERSFMFFRHILPGIVLGWGVACAMLAFVAHLFIPIFFKPEFAGASLPLWVLLASSVLWIPVAVGYAALANAISATYISLVASCFSAAANIGGNFYLIPRYGMVGSAWATFLAYLAGTIVFAVLLNRSSQVPSSWVFLAFVPSIAGAVIMTMLGAPAWALLSCIVLSLLIAAIKRDSIAEAYVFFSQFLRRRADGAV